jgi:hypothetical protein
MSASCDANTNNTSSKHAQACSHTPHGLPWPAKHAAKAPLPANLPLVKLEVNQSFFLFDQSSVGAAQRGLLGE